jgi:hypothetical protein
LRKTLKGMLATLGDGLEVEGLEAWTRVGRRLNVVDRERFRKLLVAAETIVAMYETADPESALLARLSLLDDSSSYDA